MTNGKGQSESAGCEALRAEQPVDEIRSALLPGAKRPATMVEITRLGKSAAISQVWLIDGLGQAIPFINGN